MRKRTGYACQVALIGLLALALSVPFLTTPRTLAQDAPPPVVVSGSLYLEGLVRNLVNAYQEAQETDQAEFTFEPGGNTAGFETLCAGTADLVMSTRPINDAEILNCDTNGVQFVETLLAVEGLVLIPSAGQEATCVLAPDLSSILGVAAPANLSWADISPLATSSETVTLYGPPDTDRATVLLTALLPDNQPRSDYERFEAITDILDQLADPTSNMLAFTTAAEWLAVEDPGPVTPYNVGAEELDDCVPPTAENMVTGEYGLGRRLLLYTSTASLDKAPVAGLLDFAYTDEGAATVTAAGGYLFPPEDANARNVANVTERRVGRTFSRPDTPVDLNTAAEGEITIGGASLANYGTQPVIQTFSEQYANIAVNRHTLGNTAGWSAFCSGEVSVIEVTRAATAEEQAACQENGITPYSVGLGSDAVVLLVDAANEELPACLDYDAVRQLIVRQQFDPLADQSIDAPAEDDDSNTEEDSDGQDTGDQANPQGPTNWGEVVDGLDLPLLILAPGQVASQPGLAPETDTLEADIILSTVAPGEALLPRNDGPTVLVPPRDGALSSVDYRLGGVPNAEAGALTYMFYSQWQASEGAANVRALAIGPDCVTPTPETITSGDYPFSVNSTLVVAEEALSDPVVGALLWQVYNQNMLEQLAERNLVGFELAAFESQRDAVFNLIARAQVAPGAEDETPDAPDDVPSEPDAEDDTDDADDAPAEPTPTTPAPFGG